MTTCFSESTPEGQSICNNLKPWKSSNWQSSHASDHASKTDTEPTLALQPTQNMLL